MRTCRVSWALRRPGNFQDHSFVDEYLCVLRAALRAGKKNRSRTWSTHDLETRARLVSGILPSASITNLCVHC